MRKAMTEQGLAQPVLHRDQINAIIYALQAAMRDREMGDMRKDAESAAIYLINFHTRRWGLPPCIQAIAARLGV